MPKGTATLADDGTAEVRCRVRGCPNTWTWRPPAAADEGAGLGGSAAPEPPPRMCEACYARYRTLEPRSVPCATAGCDGAATLSRFAQLEALVREERGLPGEPPSGPLCDRCRRRRRQLADRLVPCRVRGCQGTWTWTARAQRATGATADHALEPPARMCPSCQARFSRLRDLELPCKRAGCKGTWLYRRGHQLERIVQQGESAGPPPPRLCDACKRTLDALHDRQVPCRNEGCKGTWTWTRFAQLQARETGHGDRPPPRMCDACKAFLLSHPARTIRCAGCGVAIHWAPELQLKTHLGMMHEPTLCGACKRTQTIGD